MKVNSKGITIVELMIGIVLFSIIALSVTFFISTGTNMCQNAENTINLQEESQVVMNQILNLCIESNDVQISKPNADDICILIMDTDKTTDEAKTERILYFKKSSEKMYYYEVDASTPVGTIDRIRNEIEGKTTDVTQGQLLGEYLTDVKAKFDISTHTVSVELNLAIGEKAMKTSDSIVLRNKYTPAKIAYIKL